MRFTQSGRDDIVARLARLHWGIVIVALLLTLLGVAMLFSVTGGSFAPYALQHAVRLGLGLVLMLGVALIDIRFWYMAAYIIYIACLVLLLLVPLMGDAQMGARRWLDLGIIRLQPSDPMRLGLVLALARYFQSVRQDEVSHPLRLLLPLALIALPALLVMRQPDLGTGILMAILGAAILYHGGVNWRYFAAALIAGLIAVPMIWQNLLPYQQGRVLTFLYPERDPLGSGYHIIQSKLGIGSGGVSGKGFMQGTQGQLGFLPERHTDFIFTLFAEEMGFIGSLILIGLYALLFYMCFRLSLRVRAPFGRLLAMGLSLSIFLYVFVNIAMVTGLTPVVGVPLPFISYGGSSLLTFMIALGLMLSADLRANADIARG